MLLIVKHYDLHQIFSNGIKYFLIKIVNSISISSSYFLNTLSYDTCDYFIFL